ncbi:hypothetical protein AALD01_15365 [Oscillospiraceae bacterium 21-37]
MTIQEKILFTDLAATYEEQFAVPESQRLTYYFGDYGQDFLRPGVTDEQLRRLCQEALAALGLTEEEFLARSDEFTYRKNIEMAMIGGMI